MKKLHTIIQTTQTVKLNNFFGRSPIGSGFPLLSFYPSAQNPFYKKDNRFNPLRMHTKILKFPFLRKIYYFQYTNLKN